jgi:iron(III) transport system ATP-binding protein
MKDHVIAVSVRELSKSFSGHPAVQDVSLAVRRGEILSVLGPSGCGKTTLLRLIAGFEIPDSGEISIESRIVSAGGIHVPPEARRVGMVFQHHSLFPHLTVEENIAFGLEDLPNDERGSRVQHLLNLIRLPNAHARRPHSLSGGQQQRVALARALAPEPAVILMDEPFSNLDAEHRLRIRDEVRFILKQSKTTVVFVTHDQGEALFMGDQMAVMRQAEIQQIDEPEAVFRAPASSFVAEFLGQTEFLPGRALDSAILTELGNLAQVVELDEGTSIEVGFRPDDLTFEPSPKGASMVLARFFQGPVCLYRIRLPSGRIAHSLQPHYVNYPPGTRVRAWLNPNHGLPLFIDGALLPSRFVGDDPPSAD